VALDASRALSPRRDRLRGAKELFTELGCYGCHMIEKYGTPIATDLSHVGSKYNVAYLTRWLENPAAQKPTAHMPKIAMSESEAKTLAAYLASLR
jgi:hypothetical protein